MMNHEEIEMMKDALARVAAICKEAEDCGGCPLYVDRCCRAADEEGYTPADTWEMLI